MICDDVGADVLSGVLAVVTSADQVNQTNVTYL
jgi:hypothetical protein